MKIEKLFFLGLLIAGVFSACSPEEPQMLPTPSLTPTTEDAEVLRDDLTPEQQSYLVQNGYLPVFEPGECRGLVPPGFEAACGDLVVPEDRSDPQGRQVSIHVIIFKSRSENPRSDPLIYLTGGGGGNELDNTIRYLDDGMDEILDQRDFIMYNQRGAKYSTPYLACRNESALRLDLATSDYTQEEREDAIISFYTECRERLANQGINLNLYNTTVNAADFNDLRIALGYEEVNIYGTSYGSGLALAILHSYSEHIRSAIIDSVYPPQGWFYSEYGTNAYIVFQRIFEACAADPGCSQAYPDLEETLYRVVDALNANPRTMVLSGAFGDEQTQLTYDGTDYLNALYLFPYVSEPGMVPMVISESGQGNYAYIEDFMPYTLGTIASDTISAGVQYSILCREEGSPAAFQRMLDLNSQLPPQIAAGFDLSLDFRICEAWDVDLAEDWENEAVVSDVPSLIFAGEFDPITPLEWAYAAADTLRNHYIYVMPGWGHGVMRSVPCGLEIGLQFLEDPTSEPDAACIDEMPGIIFE